MNSGTFHVMSQEWRYFSREKSIVHTLHLGELTPSVTGQSVFISHTPPTGAGGQNGFNVHPSIYPPITPYQGLDWSRVTINIPPLWVSSLTTVGFNNQSGTYGFTGTSGPFNSNISNNTFEWASTGGTFLVIGYQGACANSSDLMDTMKIALFYSHQNQVFQNEFHEGQYFIRLGGGDWYNQFYVSESAGGDEPMECSAIIENVPPFHSLCIRNTTSDILPEVGGCSFFVEGIIAMRLGPS